VDASAGRLVSAVIWCLGMCGCVVVLRLAPFLVGPPAFRLVLSAVTHVTHSLTHTRLDGTIAKVYYAVGMVKFVTLACHFARPFIGGEADVLLFMFYLTLADLQPVSATSISNQSSLKREK
jgi:hypothetical protein